MYPRRPAPAPSQPPAGPRVRWTPLVLMVLIGATVVLWLTRDEPSYEQHMRRGHDAAAIGRFPDAIAAFSDAIRRRPDSAEAYRRRASAHMNIAGYEPALADLDLALGLDPGHAQAFYDRAVAKYQLDRSAAEVCPDLDRACRLGQRRACLQQRQAQCARHAPGAGAGAATRAPPAGR